MDLPTLQECVTLQRPGEAERLERREDDGERGRDAIHCPGNAS
jgi:hypothetical protein